MFQFAQHFTQVENSKISLTKCFQMAKAKGTVKVKDTFVESSVGYLPPKH